MQVSKPKKGYKFVDAGFGKLEEIPEDWDTVKIKDIIFDLVGGTPLKPKDFSSKGIPVLHKGDIKPNNSLEIGKTNPFCTKEFAEQYKSHMIDDSYLVVTLRDLVPSGPAIGLMANSDGEYLLAQGAYGFHVVASKIDSVFLIHLSNSISYRQYIKKMSVGSTQIHVRTPVFLNMSFWIPPLNEQKKITNILSNIDYTLEKTNQLIQITKHLKNGLMQKLLTKGIGHTKFKKIKWFFGKEIEIPEKWKMKTCNEISTKILDGEHTSPEYSKEGIPYISSQHVKSKILFDDCKFVSPKVYQKLAKRCNPEISDVLITVKGTIGFCKLIDITTKFCMDRNVGIIKPNQEINPLFLEQIMNSEIVQKQIYIFTDNSVIPSLYLNKIRDIMLTLPPLSEQKQIASILSNVDSQITKEKLQKSNLELLKKGLMQKLLTGKIRVKF